MEAFHQKRLFFFNYSVAPNWVVIISINRSRFFEWEQAKKREEKQTKREQTIQVISSTHNTLEPYTLEMRYNEINKIWIY